MRKNKLLTLLALACLLAGCSPKEATEETTETILTEPTAESTTEQEVNTTGLETISMLEEEPIPVSNETESVTIIENAVTSEQKPAQNDSGKQTEERIPEQTEATRPVSVDEKLNQGQTNPNPTEIATKPTETTPQQTQETKPDVTDAKPTQPLPDEQIPPDATNPTEVQKPTPTEPQRPQQSYEPVVDSRGEHETGDDVF